MSRRFSWIPVAAVLALSSLSSPWSGRGTAEAGPGPRPAPVAAACKDDLGKARQELVEARAEIARLQGEYDRMRTAERTRAQKLQAQLGAPMIERLH